MVTMDQLQSPVNFEYLWTLDISGWDRGKIMLVVSRPGPRWHLCDVVEGKS